MEGDEMWPVIRSILAVLAGIVVLTIVSFAIEAVAGPLLMRLFPTALPDAAALSANFPARLFMLAYTLFSIGVAGYFTAWIAGRAKILHAAIMGAVEVALTAYVMIAAPFPEVHPAPRWWWIAGLILMIPAAIIGGLIRARTTSRKIVEQPS
jgi:hypothetical protein